MRYLRQRASILVAASLLVLATGCATTASRSIEARSADFDVLIRGGLIYDGSGRPPFAGDIGIKDDVVVYVGPSARHRARQTVDAAGMAVAPGFINMLSWATESLIADGRAYSDIRQGVTLEIFGEGDSMGPLSAEMKALMLQRQADIKYPIGWTSLGEYLEHLERRGVSPNVASFVGAATVRVHELGERDVDPTPDQLRRMRKLVRQAMKDGALGVGSSLIYAPSSFAETSELTALASEAAACGGMYISHMRSEGDRIEAAVDELLEIARGSGARSEIYHLKFAGQQNWAKIEPVIAKIEAARASGLHVTADMYTYTAGATGLDAAMPSWVQEGGLEAWIARLNDPDVRRRVAAEMKAPGRNWENLYHSAGADRVLLVGFKNPTLKPLTGKTLAEVARLRGKTAEETAMDLVREDGSRVLTVYFLMSEDNVRRQVALPWMSFGSDAEASAPEGVFLQSSTHPRAYGTFARLLGRYVRDEKIVPLEEAIRRLTALPAANLRLDRRGSLRAGNFADVVVFDPDTIQDHATFERPMQYATGVLHVWVNGIQVLRDGQHTGAMPGRVVRGPGWTGWPGGGACPDNIGD